MELTGLWKIAEVCVFGSDFSQKWMTVEEMDADASVNMMQKVMAKTMFDFKDDGTVLALMPKEFDKDNEFGEYDDKYGVSNTFKWKSEDGKLYIAARENGEDDWQELVPNGEGFEAFGYQRITRA